jgi:hypothetical protein
VIKHGIWIPGYPKIIPRIKIADQIGATHGVLTTKMGLQENRRKRGFGPGLNLSNLVVTTGWVGELFMIYLFMANLSLIYTDIYSQVYSVQLNGDLHCIQYTVSNYM